MSLIRRIQFPVANFRSWCVHEASACMGHDGPARTADQAMGSQRPGVLCHGVAWQGRRSQKRQGSMCLCLAPLVESERQQHIARCLLRININDDRVLLLREVAFKFA